MEEAWDRLVEAQRDLSDQHRAFTAFLDMPGLTREQARDAQEPVRGAALQAEALTGEYLRALTAYANGLPE